MAVHDSDIARPCIHAPRLARIVWEVLVQILVADPLAAFKVDLKASGEAFGNRLQPNIVSMGYKLQRASKPQYPQHYLQRCVFNLPVLPQPHAYHSLATSKARTSAKAIAKRTRSDTMSKRDPWAALFPFLVLTWVAETWLAATRPKPQHEPEVIAAKQRKASHV